MNQRELEIYNDIRIMELKEADRIIVSKPVPSRPTTNSNFGSFSELLAGAINTSPSYTCTENPVSAIRPKTVRFKPSVVNASQAETSGAANFGPSDNVDKILDGESTSTVLYKPLAKVVSRKTFSMLANLGNCNVSHQQPIAHAEAHLQVSSSQTVTDKQEPPSQQLTNSEDDHKYTPATNNNDRASYDGYNWRKYGQKQVKGSEYPRSYYKCTHPNCLVKKMVEISLNGQIAEIVYKGEHNHSKPQPAKRNTSGSRGQGLLLDENIERKVENNNEEVGALAQSGYLGKGVLSYDHVVTCANENTCGVQGDCEEAEVDEPKTKKRKVETEAGISGEGAEEPRVIVPNPPTDSEIIGDGFRWRKYGQKVVKGNPNPRSYYRCTNLKCKVRKHVERSMDDPTSFVTTYEGKHNHKSPTKNTNITPSEAD